VFHTIKGVAGFLGASDVTRVAHVTETLLEDVRRGAREARGSVLEVLFEASAAMRKLLSDMRDALVTNREIGGLPDTERLVRRIEQVIAEGSGAPTAATAATTASNEALTAPAAAVPAGASAPSILPAHEHG